MDKLFIDKKHIRYYEYFFDKPSGTFIDVKKTGGLVAYLGCKVELSKELTFKDFYTHLLKEKDTLNQIFSFVVMRGTRIEDFQRDLSGKRKNKKEYKPKHVQINWRTEISENDPIEISPHFTGVKRGTNGNRENGVETALGLALTPLFIYADLPLRLNKVYNVEQFNTKKKPFIKLLLKSKKEFTLFEIIQAILYEISWHGTPDRREKYSKYLEEVIKKSKREKGIPWEEVKKNIKLKMRKKVNSPLL